MSPDQNHIQAHTKNKGNLHFTVVDLNCQFEVLSINQ